MRVEGHPWWPILLCLLPAFALSLVFLAEVEPLGQALHALGAPRPFSLPDLIIHDGFLPRMITAWVAGAGLACAATLLQHALRNPLASPTTLGISAGAGLMVAVGLLTAPALIAVARPLVALAGALVATSAVLLLARRQRLSPESLAIAGLLITLGCGAGTTCLALLQGQALGALAIWGGGSLDQRGWFTLRQILLYGGPALLLVLPLLRPLEIMQLADTGVRSLGLSPGKLRFAALLLSAWLAAAVVGGVGTIGFVGLAAGAIARLSGTTRLRAQLPWAMALGGAMLWLADEVAQLLGRLGEMPLPTGAVTALIGAPLLVLLTRRIGRFVPPTAEVRPAKKRPQHMEALLVGLALFLVLLVVASSCLGHGPKGWAWASGENLRALWPWRGPRILGALGAGICLALAGVLVQRLTDNPMASPELIGVGPAAAIAGVGLLLYDPAAGRGLQLLVGGAGALAALLVLLALVGRQGFSPSRLVLLGIGLTALLGAGLNLAVALMPLHLGLLLAWVAGSTYHVTGQNAWITLGVAGVGLACALCAWRWLDILPLGEGTARALGLGLRGARFLLVLLAAGLSAAGTLMVGPFAFIGVMAPHCARLAGAQRPVPLLLLSALMGAMLMVVADFLGRNLLFPYQLPAGTMASAFGMLAMAGLLFRR